MHEYGEVIIRVRFFMQLLLKDIRIVGFFRPIIDPTPKGTRDHDIDLVLSNFNIGLHSMRKPMPIPWKRPSRWSIPAARQR